jgi:hypothetical protein
VTKPLENKLSVGGPAGARSRDLRIKRPDSNHGLRAGIIAAKRLLASYTEPRANRGRPSPLSEYEICEAAWRRTVGS